MRIGLMLRSLDEKGGIGTYTRYLLKELLDLDDKNYYVLFFSTPVNMGKYADRPNVTERLVTASNKAFWDQIAIPLACRREKVDVLFHPKFTAPLFAPCRVVMTLHGADWLIPEHAKFYKKRDIIYMKLMMPFYCKKCTAILSVSELTTQAFNEILKLPPGKVVTTYFGPGKHFRRISDTEMLRNVKEKYRLPDKFIFTLSGYDRGKRKNIDRVLEAYRLFHGRTPHALVVGGRDCYRFKADYGVPDTGYGADIHFPDWIEQEDLPAIYTMADLYLYPSNLEAFPIPLTEAMACETPIITSNLNGLKEIAGKSALFVDAANPVEIADAMERVLTNPALSEELRARARERSKQFSWDKCARQTLHVLESVGNQP